MPFLTALELKYMKYYPGEFKQLKKDLVYQQTNHLMQITKAQNQLQDLHLRCQLPLLVKIRSYLQHHILVMAMVTSVLILSQKQQFRLA